MKVVINKCYGGFSISLEAARFMAKRGNKTAQAEVKEYDDKVSNKEKQDALEKKYGVHFFGYGYTEESNGYERNDPDLVAAVEELGKGANGSHADLRVVDIPDDVEFEIDNYDGIESIHEKHQIWR